MALFDPGLQGERTELAWRRTTLSIAAGSLVAMRLLPAIFGSALWVLPGVLGLIASGAIWLAARHRYEGVSHATRTHGDRAHLPDGRLPLAITGFATAVGVLGVAIVIVQATH